MADTLAAATPVSAAAIVSELRRLGISHVINVPDTHQRTLLSELARQDAIALLTACTEDEAIAINAGLWIGGERPMLLIQQVGLLAALNNVRGICLDARIPTCMLVGYFGRDVTRPACDNAARAVHLIEPTLDAWGVPYFALESTDDLPVIEQAYRRGLDDSGPSVILVGAPTAD